MIMAVETNFLQRIAVEGGRGSVAGESACHTAEAS